MRSSSSSGGFRPCAVIPFYNNRETVNRVIAKVRRHVGCVIAVDDGSTDGSAQTIEPFTGLVMVARGENGGKGAAVRAGLLAARERGFSHVVQLDADDQHDTEDIPRFLEAARGRPEALIVGDRIFDENAPLNRRVGRSISNFWVWLETAWEPVEDVLCGFRVYPVEAFFRINPRTDRMDFDVEVITRAVWSHVPLINMRTRVRYGPPGQHHSSFHMLYDNLRLVRLHTGLMAQAGLKLPGVVAHRRRKGGWLDIPEVGSALGMRMTVMVLRALGLPWGYLMSYPIALYYLAMSPVARGASWDYLGRVLDRPGWEDVVRQFTSFAESIVDRMLILMGEDLFELEEEGGELLEGLRRSGQGAILVGSHLGCLEAARYMARKRGVRVSVVNYLANASRFNGALEALDPSLRGEMIDVGEGAAGLALEVKARVEGGEMVAILADRVVAGRTGEVSFLGGRVRLPLGPYLMASALGCPVVLVFGIKVGGRRYRVFVEPLEGGGALEMAGRFASALERYCRRYPYQWYNFFDVWEG